MILLDYVTKNVMFYRGWVNHRRAVPNGGGGSFVSYSTQQISNALAHPLVHFDQSLNLQFIFWEINLFYIFIYEKGLLAYSAFKGYSAIPTRISLFFFFFHFFANLVSRLLNVSRENFLLLMHYFPLTRFRNLFRESQKPPWRLPCDDSLMR